MSNDIKLTIELPTGVVVERQVPAVVLPAVRAPIEILPDRAPSVFVLDYGAVEITGKKGEVQDKYYIYSGAAQVAENQCRIMTQNMVAAADINVNKAKELMDNAQNENQRLFYEMIIDHIRGVRRRYLRTLQAMRKKKGRWAFRKRKDKRNLV
ncbi:MAG: F0F1 ATP synthase subunit epsilon [Alphaproteobacteria bacterium]|nr:F0F1 ATP synthase subunit epsilon [Alphaproteobacteria bacterium]